MRCQAVNWGFFFGSFCTWGGCGWCLCTKAWLTSRFLLWGCFQLSEAVIALLLWTGVIQYCTERALYLWNPTDQRWFTDVTLCLNNLWLYLLSHLRLKKFICRFVAEQIQAVLIIPKIFQQHKQKSRFVPSNITLCLHQWLCSIVTKFSWKCDHLQCIL